MAATRPAASAPHARVYPLPEAAPAEEPVATPRPVGPDSEPPVDVTVAAQAAPVPTPPSAPTAGQRYRAALDLVGRREYARAISELNEAILLDPRLAVAYAARASAQFGLGKVREAAEDYRAALGLAPDLATPLYGLGECHRLLGDPTQAAEYYGRYAESQAPDAREELREVARRRVAELGSR
jgi:tetratricopeptide (TPR) repeat protein